MDRGADERVFGNLSILSLTIDGQDWSDEKSVDERAGDVEGFHSPSA